MPSILCALPAFSRAIVCTFGVSRHIGRAAAAHARNHFLVARFGPITARRRVARLPRMRCRERLAAKRRFADAVKHAPLNVAVPCARPLVYGRQFGGKNPRRTPNTALTANLREAQKWLAFVKLFGAARFAFHTVPRFDEWPLPPCSTLAFGAAAGTVRSGTWRAFSYCRPPVLDASRFSCSTVGIDPLQGWQGTGGAPSGLLRDDRKTRDS